MLYLNDTNGQTWLVTIDNNGVFDTTPVASQPTTTVILNDYQCGTLSSWQMGISIAGELLSIPVTFGADYPFGYLLGDWWIRAFVTPSPLACEWETASATDRGVISYTPPGGSLTTFSFQWPLTNVPRFDLRATRHDNIASSGVREPILERIDEFLGGDMQFVAAGADLTNWNLFMRYALGGGPFDLTPPAIYNIPKTTCELWETDWKAAYRGPGIYKFSVLFRKWVSWP